MSILIENAKAIVTIDRQDRVLRDTNILIEGNIIKKIGPEKYQADTIIDAKNMFVYPGLINTHHHLYQTFTRNLPQVQKMELFNWLTTLYEIWRELNPDVIYYSSLIGMADLLKNGCTTVFDHHYVFPKINNKIFIDQQFSAAKLLGVRFHASRGSMSLGKNDGGLPPDDLVQTTEEILKDSERLIDKYHDANFNSMKQIVLAPCSPFSITSDLLKESAKLARHKDVRLHTHLAETIDEENFCIEKFGMRPLAYMESVDWIGNDVWYAHGIHFNDEELKLLASTGTGIAHCPISNMKLSSGVAEISKMLELGVPVGLAVDGSASNDGSNLLEEIRVCYLLHRLKYSHLAPTAYSILKIATKGGAKILGRNDIGSIEEGKPADLFMINIDNIDCVGAKLDPQSILGTVGIKRPVDYTIINGKIVVKNGKLYGIDEERLAYEANKVFDDFIKNSI
ncbi:8-oxoguanine deaminase [Maledivibacter halophilus]|uniref:Cytosine/adenosine deaminase n=1 Tax=Maledivibacter halophilus TaxID=36842 RepID=A0A1T5M9I1_9FIRM|nr:8-oxoguanine deaminase [Maledivibacter halophilus]SKC84795.1 Cytosine/adenosine deaminase [Maledivibacter halophilus]